MDGHSTHFDLEISKFCEKNSMLLYCIPAHSSHITEPPDVSFYGLLKQAWKKAVSTCAAQNLGMSVTKETIARTFREAWDNTVKVPNVVSSFKNAGIYPVNFSAI